MGDWLAVYGESIYGSDASPFDKPSWGRFTQKEGEVFAHIFEWPEDGTLRIPLMDGRPYKSIQIIDCCDDLAWEIRGDDAFISLPLEAPDAIATVVKLEY